MSVTSVGGAELGLHDFFYSDIEWAESAGHSPFAGLPAEEFALLHRHWMLSNQVRLQFERELQLPPQAHESWPAAFASSRYGFMLLWYALLWVVLEGCGARGIEFRGRFRSDIEALSDVLRRFRNAVLHVPKSGSYVDDRLTALVQHDGSAQGISRISHGLGRAFLEEFARRRTLPTDVEE